MTMQNDTTPSRQAPTTRAQSHTLLLVSCAPTDLHPILDDFTDRLALFPRAQILHYGRTGKAQQGFLLIQFAQPDGLDRFCAHLDASEDILDYVRVDSSIVGVSSTPPTP